jgi:hypothetical protein
MSDIAAADTFRVANVFSKAFAVYSRRFVPFFILTVIASIPNYIALLAIRIPTTPAEIASSDLAAMTFARVALTLINVATSTLAGGAVIYGVIQDLRGRTFSIGDSIGIALRRVLPLLGIGISLAIIIGLGVLLLIVPGLIFACMYFVSSPVCVAERTGVFASMSRSRLLTKGHRWQVLGIFLLMLIVIIALSSIAGLAFTPTGATGVMAARLVVGAVVGSFNGVLVSVLYYELRAAKEGVDIDKIASVFD